MVSEQTITYLDVVCWVAILVSTTLYNDFVCVSMCVDAVATAARKQSLDHQCYLEVS